MDDVFMDVGLPDLGLRGLVCLLMPRLDFCRERMFAIGHFFQMRPRLYFCQMHRRSFLYQRQRSPRLLRVPRRSPLLLHAMSHDRHDRHARHGRGQEDFRRSSA